MPPLGDGNEPPGTPDATGVDPTPAAARPGANAGTEGLLGPGATELVISHNGSMIPLTMGAGGWANSGVPEIQSEAFANSSAGVLAWVDPTGRVLQVGGSVLNGSPAVPGLAVLPETLAIRDLSWSPDGQRLAFRIDTLDPSDPKSIDSGIWVFEQTIDPNTGGQAHHILRNTWADSAAAPFVQAAQWDQAHQALSVAWAPDSLRLLIRAETGTPLGGVTILRHVGHQADDPVDLYFPYADATWGIDGQSVILSGAKNGQSSEIGRYRLETGTTETYLQQDTTGLVMQAAVEYQPSALAFLGTSAGDQIALYTAQASSQPGATPIRRSNQFVTGRVVSAEWHPENSGVLAKIETAPGAFQLWVFWLGGSVENVTPQSGVPSVVHWRR